MCYQVDLLRLDLRTPVAVAGSGAGSSFLALVARPFFDLVGAGASIIISSPGDVSGAPSSCEASSFLTLAVRPFFCLDGAGGSSVSSLLTAATASSSCPASPSSSPARALFSSGSAFGCVFLALARLGGGAASPSSFLTRARFLGPF